MRWFWGFIFVLIGMVYLGNNFGWWDSVNFSYLWSYWPLLLILFGLSLIAKSWKYGWVVMVVAVILSVFLIFYTAIINKDAVTINQQQEEIQYFKKDIPREVDSAEVVIESGAVELNINDKCDNCLVSGDHQSNFTNLKIEDSVDNHTARVFVKTESNTTNFSLIGIKNILNLKITDSVPVELKINSGASDMNLDLSKINVSSLDIKSGASDIDLILGKVMKNGGISTINAGASSIKVKVPKDLGVEVNISGGLTSKNITGFKETDSNKFVSDNYDETDTKIQLNIKTGASSVTVEKY